MHTTRSGTCTYWFAYDGDSQQVQVTAPDGSRETYFYDHKGDRVLALREPVAGTPDRLRLWFGETEVWYTGSFAVDKTWVHVGLGTPVARIENGTNVEYSYHSLLGHQLASLTSSGWLKAGFTYGPFGEILDAVGSTDDHLRRFNGKEADQLSGLSYYGVRYYGPLSMSWTQADPLYRVAPDIAYDEPRRMSLYVFSGNNPYATSIRMAVVSGPVSAVPSRSPAARRVSRVEQPSVARSSVARWEYRSWLPPRMSRARALPSSQPVSTPTR